MPASTTGPRGCEHPCEHPRGAHGDASSLPATAPPNARRWMLIEYPGPWPDLRTESDRLPAPIARAFRRAEEHGVRPQLVRRPGDRRTRDRRTRGEALVITCRSEGEEPWLSATALADLEELDAFDLEPLRSGRRTGVPMTGPLFLVCCNARRNACCARLGLPLARSLEARFPGRVWETSHVGGDAHAPNLVCLPHGLYYGALSEDTAAAAAEAYTAGRVDLDRYRGRAGLDRALQAAEHSARARTGESSVGARLPAGRGAAAPGTRHRR
ncbi:sucrase ferredoxin [Spirillospora sp. CA-255316]